MITGSQRTVAPTAYPITMQEALTQVRQSDTSDAITEEMARLIAVATEQAESVTRKALITQTWQQTHSDWPSDGVIRLRRQPVQSVTAITYTDTNGDAQTWDASNYRLNTVNGRITLAYNKLFPTIRIQDQSITITYVAGYGASHGDVPPMIRHAILGMITHWYDYRGEILSGTIQSTLPLASQHLLLQERNHVE